MLVNNASAFERDEWHDATRESWDAHLETNLRAPFVLMQHFARALPAAAEGVVVNMLDQRVWSLTPHFVSYTVAKAGLWALTQTMALALAPAHPRQRHRPRSRAAQPAPDRRRSSSARTPRCRSATAPRLRKSLARCWRSLRCPR